MAPSRLILGQGETGFFATYTQTQGHNTHPHTPLFLATPGALQLSHVTEPVRYCVY